MNLKQAIEVAGRFSIQNSKMPGSTFSTSPFACQLGELLSKVEGSTCSGCYARRLVKLRPNLKKSYERNLFCLINSDSSGWIQGAVLQLHHAVEKTGQPFHRWFDFGDLPSKDAFLRIVEVAERTPRINHWLPTREIKFIRDVGVPDNLIVRVSAPMIDQSPLKNFEHTSTVHKKIMPLGHICPAPTQGHKCGDCRACWDKGVENVSYKKH